MAYKKTRWKDHVVQRPRTYTKVSNGDGSETFNPAPGEVLQQGTPQSATNFNNLETGLQHYGVAFDWLYTTTQALIRAQDARIATIESQISTLTST